MTGTSLSRRDFFRLTGIGAAALALSACAQAAPSVAPAPTAAQAIPISNEFQPTDPFTVHLAAGRPQLVEFYAVW